MKILHIINSLSKGGAEKLVVDLCNGLVNEEHTCDVFILSDKDNVFHHNLNIYKVNLIKSKYSSIYNPLNILAIKKIGQQYDILHVHLFPAFYWVALAKFLGMKCTIVFTEHNTINRRRKKLFYRIERFIYSRFNKIICNSEKTKTNLEYWLNNNINAKVIFNGIDYDKYAFAKKYSIREYLALNNKDIIIIMAAAFTKQKDHITILNALMKLPQNYKLIFMGDGPKRHEYEAYIQNQGLTNRAFIIGFRMDIDKIFKDCDIYIMSSNWEGFGLATLEAMASGLPIIATCVDGLAQLVDSSGLMFEIGDVDTLVNHITLFENPKIYKEYSLKSQKRAKKFRIYNTINEHIKAYKEVFESDIC